MAHRLVDLRIPTTPRGSIRSRRPCRHRLDRYAPRHHPIGCMADEDNEIGIERGRQLEIAQRPKHRSAPIG